MSEAGAQLYFALQSWRDEAGELPLEDDRHWKSNAEGSDEV